MTGGRAEQASGQWEQHVAEPASYMSVSVTKGGL